MRLPYFAQLQGIAPSTADFTLTTEKFPDNRLFCLQRVSVANDTTAGKYACIGLNLGNDVIWLQTIVLTTATYWYALVDPVFLRTVRGVCVKILSPASGDVIRANVFGYYED